MFVKLRFWCVHPGLFAVITQTVVVIVTQSQPRCEDNFSRKLYNGFGQLIQEQTPRWAPSSRPIRSYPTRRA
ncbi:MAG: hypothetical protein OXG26_10215 [Caldilineaceae bacterium]|nr:hypothetical protein [Caldilineaceae bacterium]